MGVPVSFKKSCEIGTIILVSYSWSCRQHMPSSCQSEALWRPLRLFPLLFLPLSFYLSNHFSFTDALEPRWPHGPLVATVGISATSTCPPLSSLSLSFSFFLFSGLFVHPFLCRFMPVWYRMGLTDFIPYRLLLSASQNGIWYWF